MTIDGQLSFDEYGPGDEHDDTAAFLAGFAEPHVDLSRPYGAMAETYWRAGWTGVLPLPAGKKHAPPVGWTGSGAPYLSYADLYSLTTGPEAAGNICLRMPDVVVGLDVDDYGAKHGWDELCALVQRLGELPATWRSSARGADTHSGIYFYRVPGGLHWKGNAAPSIEVIQQGHRYAVVWPSTNPDAGGALYRWYDPSGTVADELPKVDELPEMPRSWIEDLQAHGSRIEALELRNGEVAEWLKGCRSLTCTCQDKTRCRGHMCGQMRNILERGLRELRGGRSRHDVALQSTRAILGYAGEGHTGGVDALKLFRAAFVASVTSDTGGLVRDRETATREFMSLVFGGVRVAAARNPVPEPQDPDPSCISWDENEELPPWYGPVQPRRQVQLEDEDGRRPRSQQRNADSRGAEAEREDSGSVQPSPNGNAGADEDDTPTGEADGGEPAKPVEKKARQARPLDVQFTDARLAERVAEQVLAGAYCHTGALGWLRWDGKRWLECDEKFPIEAVREYMLDWYISELRSGDATVERKKALASLCTAARIRAVTMLARGIAGIAREAADFDTDPDLLNVHNGVVDLRTGKLLPHDPARSITKMCAVSYEPGKTHPDWDKALKCLPADVLPWYQVRLGQAITGYMTSDDVLIVAQGGGENGKSTMHGTVGAVLGSYYTLVSDRVLMANPNDHPTELMDLRGARLAVLEETPEARRLNVARLKKVIGTPSITARHIRANSVTFSCTHSLFVSSNYRPIVEETDHGTWRRLALVVFPYKYIKPHQVAEMGGKLGPNQLAGDAGLRERLLGSVRRNGPAARAALAWLIEGAKSWYAHEQVMPAPPAQVASATRAWRAESDQVLSYIEERLELDPAAFVMASDLLADFNGWLTLNNHRGWSDKTLAARFGDHDEIAGKVTKRKGRTGKEGLSRPTGIDGQWLTQGYKPEVPATCALWFGIKFRKTDDSDALSAE